MQVGDQCSKDFFKIHRQRVASAHITALKGPSGIVHTSQEELLEVGHQFYQMLYKARTPPTAVEGAEFLILRHVSNRLSLESKTSLEAPITLGELERAMKEMALENAPGPDGVILEFYQCYWDIIGKDFHEMILSSINCGQLPIGTTRGMIALLHKGGDRQDLSNWRPITLLNLSYKIFAKALQLRLQPILMEIINPEQSAFLPLRFILDNLSLTQETMAWAGFSCQPLLFLL